MPNLQCAVHFWFNKIVLICIWSQASITHLTSAQVVPGNELRKAAYTVALHPNEIHRQRDWFITVLVQRLDIVQEVCEEFVAPFQHAQSYDVVSPHVLDDVAGQTLCPGPEREDTQLDEDRERKQIHGEWQCSVCVCRQGGHHYAFLWTSTEI